MSRGAHHALISLLLCGCATPSDTDARPSSDAQPPVLRRLSQSQYTHAIRDLIGPDIYVPPDLDSALRVDGLEALGTARLAVSPRGVERYEQAAFLIAEEALTPERRATVVPCTPTAVTDDECAATFVRTLGRRAWRRPLRDAEVTELVDLANTAALALNDFHAGLTFALAGLLQSPHFLMRVELGVEDPSRPGSLVYSDDELASRLAFFLWDTLPDDALLDAAERGELATDDGLDAQVVRMVSDPRAHDGLRAWAADLLRLSDLRDVRKDPSVFENWTEAVLASAEEQTLRSFEDQVFTRDDDLGDLLTTRRVFVDPTLARLYELPAPALDGFGVAWLPPDGPRAGLFGQVSFLALQAHAASSSATLRGRFIRQTLLCQTILPPPAGVNTSIPEPSPASPTLRERVAVHLESPSCAPCHKLMDPLGLALEQFDGAGSFRTTEGGATIDVSGELDGSTFTGALGLAQAVRAHEDFVPCMVEQVARFAVGRPIADDEQPELDALIEGFRARGHRLQPLWMDLAQSPMFRRVGALP